MATAPANTFIDSLAAPDILQAIKGLLNLPNEIGDTLIDVVNDPKRRNKLIDDNNLLKGVRMTPDGPQASSRELIERPNSLKAIVNTVATIETTTVEAEYTEKLMESNYNSVSVKGSAPYVTATADYSDESSYTNTETEKTVLVSSRYLFPQGRVDLSPPGSGFVDDVKLSKVFTDAIDAALANSTPSAKREALVNVFQEFGDVFCTSVQIGGVLSAHTMETFSRSETETTVKQDIKAGLEVAVKDWGTSTSAAHGNTQTTITTKQGRQLDVKYIVMGGDYTKIQKTDEWINSTSNSTFWRIIQVDNVVPIVDMLPDPIKTTVKNLMLPLLGQWMDVEPVPGTDAFPVAIYRPKGTIPSGWYFLGHAADSKRALIVKPTFALKSGRNPDVTNGRQGSGFTDQPFPNVPQYKFLSTYFGGFSASAAPGNVLAALRPGLFLEGKWELHGSDIETAVYITRPIAPTAPEDTCFDLQPVVQVNQPQGSDNPPKPRWALRKNVVYFNSGET